MIPFPPAHLAAIAFCAGFAVWADGIPAVGDALTLVMGLAFAVASVALVYYLRTWNRFLGR